MRRFCTLAPIFLVLTCTSCRPKPCDTEAPLNVSLLVGAEQANQGPTGESWPTELVVAEFEREPSEAQFQFDEIATSEEENLGLEGALNIHRETVFPGEPLTWPLELDPKARYLVAIARFRKNAGGWVYVHPVPKHHQERACEAMKSRETVPDPCVYLLLEDYQILGGDFPPAGLNRTDFEVTCASIMK